MDRILTYLPQHWLLVLAAAVIVTLLVMTIAHAQCVPGDLICMNLP